MSATRMAFDSRRISSDVLEAGWFTHLARFREHAGRRTAWLWHELTRPRGSVVATWLLRGTGAIGLAGLVLVLVLPATAPLVGLCIVSLWLNGPLSMFFPTTLEPIVMLFGRVYEPLLVAAAATAGNMYVEFLNYHLYRRLLGLERLRSLRDSRVVRLSVRLFRRMPFFTTWLCAWSILPYWTVRFIAPITDYPLRRYMMATLLGRFPKMWLFAALGVWLGLGADVLLFVTGGVILIAVAATLTRHVGRDRRRGVPASAESGAAASARPVASAAVLVSRRRVPSLPRSLPGGRPDGGISLLVDAPEFRERLTRDLSAATKRAWLQVMTFEGDEAGRSIAAAMRACRAPDRRVIIDSYTRHFLSDRFLYTPRNLFDRALREERRSTAAMVAELREAGVKVQFVGPVGLFFFQMPARQHKKIVVIDDDIAYIGGINFSDHNFAWHDLMLRVQSIEISAFLRSDLDATWRGSAASSRARFNGIDLYSVAGFRNEVTLEPILDLIRGARESVIVHSAYITFPFCDALREARRRGVQVTVLTPNSNNRGVLRRYILRECERSDFELRLGQNGMSHLKAMLVDGRWLITGSANFDWLAYRYHAEVLAVISRPEVIAEFRSRVLEPDLAASLRPARPHGISRRRAMDRRGRNAEGLLRLMSAASRVLCRRPATLTRRWSLAQGARS